MFSVINLNWLRILWKQISSFWIAPHPPVCNVLGISCRFSNFPPVHLGIGCIPEHVITTIHPFDGCSNVSRKLPCSLNISRVSVGIHPPGSVVILPVLISFEEVGLAVSLPDKYRVYVGNISFERPVSVVVDLPGSQKFSVVVIFPEPKDKTESDKVTFH